MEHFSRDRSHRAPGGDDVPVTAPPASSIIRAGSLRWLNIARPVFNRDRRRQISIRENGSDRVCRPRRISVGKARVHCYRPASDKYRPVWLSRGRDDKNKAPHLLGRCGARIEIKLCNIERRKRAFIYSYVLTIVTKLTIRLNTYRGKSAIQ